MQKKLKCEIGGAMQNLIKLITNPFCFGSALRKHMLPYLKSLHFLPVKFRIEFKIALLTHKCLHGYAPTYLKNLINSRSVSERYSLRVNDDNWLLQTVTSLNFARS